MIWFLLLNTGVLPISSKDLDWPSVLTIILWLLFSMKPAPLTPEDLLAALIICSIEIFDWINFSGWISIWYCLTLPPNIFTSATPGIDNRWGIITRSVTVLISVKDFVFDVIPIPKTDDAADVSGVILGIIPGGILLEIEASLSEITCLFL